MNLIKYLLSLMLTVTLISCGGDDDDDDDDGQDPGDPTVISFDAKLTGEQSVPPVSTEESAEASVDISEADDGRTMDAEVDLSNVEDVEAAHIHAGEVGVNGEVVFPFEDSDNDGVWAIDDTDISQAQYDSLVAGKWYVNVHTTDYPDGEIRGQVVSEHQTVYTFTMNGEQTVPSVNSEASADAYMLYDSEDGAVTVNVLTENVEPTAAHLHSGDAGTNGDAIVELSANAETPALWQSPDDAVLSVSEETSLMDGMLYVDLHTANNPDGIIRGQVLPENYEVMVFDIEPSQEVPRVDSSVMGKGYATLNTDTGGLRLNAWTQQDADITAAHIHDGEVATNGDVVVTLEQDAEQTRLWSTPVNTSLSSDMQETFLNGGHYVNMHTEAHPDGELRGQIISAPWDVLTFVANGEQEVPVVDTSAFADGYALINTSTGELNLSLITEGITTIDAAHIHSGQGGVNGTELVDLESDGTEDHILRTPDDTSLTEEELTLFLNGGYYVDVHTPEFPDGEIRGQIVGDNASVFSVTLNGDSVVPPVSTDATATGMLTLNEQTGLLNGVITTSGMTGTTAQIRQADFGVGDGDLIVELTESGDNMYVVPDNTYLTSEQIETMMNEGFYVTVNSAAYVDGEIRAQIAP